MNSRPEVKPHTGLRGVAAILVVMYHLQFNNGYHLQFETVSQFFNKCYLVVDLFFIMSGFIITYVSISGKSATLTLGIGTFMGRRIVRLYPLLVFTLAYFALAMLLASLIETEPHAEIDGNWDRAGLSVLLSQLLMVNAWVPLPARWNVPSWSISAELTAYLLFPFIIRLRERHSTAMLSLLVAFPMTFYGAIAASGDTLDTISVLAPARCLAGFAIGMIIYFSRERLLDLTSRQLSVVQLIGCVGAVTIMALPLNDVFIIPCFAMIVAATCTSGGILSQALSNRPVLYLGAISYSIYLNHVCLIVILRLGWDKFVGSRALDPDLDRAMWLATSLASVILFSAFTYRFVELPARAYLTKRFLGVRAGPLSASPSAP